MDTNSNDLRTSVMRTSTARLEQLLSSLPGSHSEIGDLDVLVRVEEKVLGLEISMADVESMAVVDSFDDLLEVVESLLRRESTSRDEVVEEFSSGNVFHDEVAVESSKKSGRKRVSSGERTREGEETKGQRPPAGREEKERRVRTDSSPFVSHTSNKFITFG